MNGTLTVPAPGHRDEYRFGAGPRPMLIPGTTGWTASDLDDPEIERLWFKGRYEIIEGVLTQMPPAYFSGGAALFRLLFLINLHLQKTGIRGSFAPEADIIMSKPRVVVADAAFLTPDDQARQLEAVKRKKRKDPKRSRIYIPPTLIIESVSEGKERHDRETKRRWYADFGVPNYWLLDSYDESLECLTLRKKGYQTDQLGRKNDQVAPSLFPGLVISLQDVWDAR